MTDPGFNPTPDRAESEWPHWIAALVLALAGIGIMVAAHVRFG